MDFNYWIQIAISIISGITFASAQANNFKTDVDEVFDNSPAI